MAQNIGSVIPTRTAAEWAALNPLIIKGQLVHESDTLAFKVGDGVNRYNDLRYSGLVPNTG
ncbi:tail protein [Gordonia phage Pleakley]|uniref:Tail protein n=1 Tax=Gordonia phage Pleakley TaxID=2283246 RepID=A0A345M6E6_9CAUD|nr:tail protein [Gordonia phage Pleakley]AXH49754.1 tail protein [Gordonia phage Fury]AXH66067.1 tail protein [Gordonia phage Pleakley]